MKVIHYCPFCKAEHEVTYESTYSVQFVDEGILRVYKCHRFNREFKIKELQKIKDITNLNIYE